MLHYFINQPGEDTELYHVVGDFIISKKMTKETRLLVYATNREEAMELIRKWRAGNIFVVNMRTIKQFHPEDFGCEGLDPMSEEFFKQLATHATQTLYQPTPWK